MQSGKGSITIWLSFSIILLSAGLVCHVLSIPAVLDAAGRDAWLSNIVAAPFFLLFVLMMYRVIRRTDGRRLTDWIQDQFGAATAWTIRITSSIMIFVLGTHTLYETSFWAVTTYLQFTPIALIVSVGVLVPLIAACLGIRSIAITSSIILPVVLFLGYFVMTANTRYKDYSRLLPVMEYGMGPVWEGTVYALAALMEIWILIYFHHEVKSRFKLWHMLALVVFMIGMAVGPTMSAITEFGPYEAMKQRSPPFEQWKLVNIGKLLQHVDFLSIYQWLCGSFGRIAISLYLIVDLLEIRKPRARYSVLTGLAVGMGGISVYWWRSDLVYEYLKRVQFPVMLAYVYTLMTFLAILTLIRRKDKMRRKRRANKTDSGQEGQSGQEGGRSTPAGGSGGVPGGGTGQAPSS
ncbi:GerAB/ArcD/ProY family transporter [Cohnella fermenti]|uniref:Uncharacterized protein n=1 Tax=Cohnella fermenti TaxID=2565925 RepID=A0A4S4BNE3_9BACL|nr:endospore germination permease [Cohnella fermenti]THF76384.1 hypothetical protein E6C55_19110 [Cohnella fermenti]